MTVHVARPRLDILALILGTAFALMWSSAFTSARIIVAEAPPLLSLAIRFACSGGLALILGWAMGQSLRLNAAQWKMVVVFGLCQNALYLGLYFVAMQTVPASVAAITASTMPLMVALLSRLVLGQRLGRLGTTGLVLGFAGVALILGQRLTAGADLHGLALCAGGVLALAVATLSMRGASAGGNLMMVVGLQMLVGALAVAIVGGLTETWDVTWTPRLAVALAYTTLIPGLAATFAWFVLVARIGAVEASAFHFLNPVFGTAMAAILLGESFGLTDAAGVAIVAAGILCVQLSKRG